MLCIENNYYVDEECGYFMNINNELKEVINDKLERNSEVEFIAGLKDITLSDIDYIEKLSAVKNLKSKLNYQIVDNTYIKIDCSL
ncbi:hypothetical protein BJV38_003539 [Clostridium beijerinckii]|nr:hypothetical protein [Clostridium beijerinckii]NRT46696.1 hypothetical protein [Clostridium beijerinckii]NRZ19299.1 hypothetical protein [Clostridium beijerinckii]